MSPIYGSRRTHHKTKFTFTKMAFLNFHTWCRPKTFPISGNCTSLSPKHPLCLPLSSHLIQTVVNWHWGEGGRLLHTGSVSKKARRQNDGWGAWKMLKVARPSHLPGHMLQKCLNIKKHFKYAYHCLWSHGLKKKHFNNTHSSEFQEHCIRHFGIATSQFPISWNILYSYVVSCMGPNYYQVMLCNVIFMSP